MIKLILGSLLIIVIASYVFHGFHKTYPIIESKLPAQTVVYLEHIGSYHKIGDTFKIVGQDLKEASSLFSNPRMAAVYHDSPLELADHSTARVTIGIFVPPSERASAVEFSKKFPNYELKDLPAITTVKSEITYVSPLTNFWWMMTQYSKMIDLIRNNIKESLENPMVIEYYELKEDTVGKIETHVPYGQGISQWILAKAPQPLKK